MFRPFSGWAIIRLGLESYDVGAGAGRPSPSWGVLQVAVTVVDGNDRCSGQGKFLYIYILYACSIAYAILHAMIILVSLSTRYHLRSFVCLIYTFTALYTLTFLCPIYHLAVVVLLEGGGVLAS
jgi:hypothetical protein